LNRALGATGYENLRYFKFSEGYAVVTGMEQIRTSGEPLPGRDRWPRDAKFVSEFSISSYLKSLFMARKGFFRLIVFVVTADAMPTMSYSVTRSGALGWLKTGWTRLPPDTAKKSYSELHSTSALIYEFAITENTTGPVFSEPSLISAEQHLRGGKL